MVVVVGDDDNDVDDVGVNGDDDDGVLVFVD